MLISKNRSSERRSKIENNFTEFLIRTFLSLFVRKGTIFVLYSGFGEEGGGVLVAKVLLISRIDDKGSKKSQ